MSTPQGAARGGEEGEIDATELTLDERNVLARLAQGYGVVAVAEVLGRPPELVRSALISAIAKLGARSKLEAVVIGLRKGLIDLPRR